jgi:hypothetical protein
MSVLELLKASTVDEMSNSVKLPSGFTPGLYGTARECLALCGAVFDPKSQTHQFPTTIKVADGLKNCLEFVVGMEKKDKWATLPAPKPEPVEPETHQELRESEPDEQWIGLNQVIADKEVQSREQLSMLAVEDYRRKLTEGRKPPAINVVFDGTKYWVSDGFHRFEAHKLEGKTEINCNVAPGSRRDAILASAGANTDNAVHRSPGDRRRAIKMVLTDTEGVTWSDHRIASHVDVSDKTVGTVRRELEASGEIKPQDVVISKAGKAVAAKKSKPASSGSGLGFDREPRASTEHGSTQKDQRPTFNSARLVEAKLRKDSAGLREFTLGKITSKTNEGDMAGEARITLMPERFIYNWQAKNRGHGGPLEAKSWNVAVIELLGMYGIVSPDLVITWVNLNGDQISAPEDPEVIKPLSSKPKISTTAAELLENNLTHYKGRKYDTRGIRAWLERITGDLNAMIRKYDRQDFWNFEELTGEDALSDTLDETRAALENLFEVMRPASDFVGEA